MSKKGNKEADAPGALATLGRRALPELGEATAFTFVVRGIVRPPELPENVIWISARPPFPVAAELALFRQHEVTALFVQASGGEVTYAKIEAARALRLPVAMLTRPQPPAGAAGSVVAQKCAMNRDVFKSIHLASRRIESCQKVAQRCKGPVDVHQVDADNAGETAALIRQIDPIVHIVFVSGYSDYTGEDLLEVGGSDQRVSIMPKPVWPAQLRSITQEKCSVEGKRA